MSKRDWGANQFLSKPLCFEGSTNHGVMYVVLSIKVLKFCNLLLLNVIIQILYVDANLLICEKKNLASLDCFMNMVTQLCLFSVNLILFKDL